MTHFSAEKKYMEAHNYPEFAKHKALHLEFMENFGDLKREIEEEGPGLHPVVRTNRMVVEWLLNHIRKVDRSLGHFLKQRFEK